MNYQKYFICILSIIFLFSNFSYAKKLNQKNFEVSVDGQKKDIVNYKDNPINDFEHNESTIFIPNGPTTLKDIKREMKTAGYWISKIQNPDKLVLTKKQIQEKNKELFKDLIYLNNIENYSQTIKVSSLKKQQKQIFKLFYYRKYIDEQFNEISKKYVKQIYKNIQIPKQKKIQTQYAITINYTDIRLMPTSTNFLYDKTTYDIDRMQVSSLDIGEPLIALLKTKDKKWTYVISYNAEGWIKSEDIAFATKKEFDSWINSKNFAVVTNTKADIFMNTRMTKYYCYIRMSTKLPIIKSIGKYITSVKIPYKNEKGNLIIKKGYIYSSAISKGYLKYTQRNILVQAFKHLNSPYSWGGYNGEQDCSTFVRQVFGCFGLKLPRNSSAQIKSGNKVITLNKNISDDEKNKEIISNTTPAISLLYLPGHIMIYVGNENNMVYIIHAIWGSEDFINKNESVVSYINKVVVSNLNIGEKTSKGSLLKRITKVNTLTLVK